MKSYQLKWHQNIPISAAEAWKFFSSPLNLEKITPPDMKFIITSDYTEDTVMYPGMIITYKVSPLFGIKMHWVTEISHIKENEYFVDDQRLGPFALWHHEHHFEEIPGGVHMTDILTYAISYGPLGRLANRLMVHKKIKGIFKYREKAIVEMFGVAPPNPPR